MTHVSKKKIDKNLDQILEELLLSIHSNKNTTDTSRIHNLLLTKTETTMLKKRLGVFLLLNKGLTLQQTAEVLKLTKQTVHRIKLQLHGVPEEDIKFLQDEIKKWKRINEFKEILLSIKDLNISQANFRQKLAKHT